MLNRIPLRLALVSVLMLLASAAAGDNGRIELSQASIGAAGGFPFSIREPGSYVLTSSIDVPDGTTGILIAAHEVSLDLNGFGIRGTHLCDPGGCSTGSTTGIEAVAVGSELARSTTVRNGVVSGFGLRCLDLGAGASVEDLIVRSCGGSGIRAAEHARVETNRISDCGAWGIEFLAAASYAGNILSNVDRLGSTGFIAGGASAGGNICDTGRCPGERRRFYLTNSTHTGNHGADDCTAGFHMASIYEILDPSNLDYDRNLGRVHADSGAGPPDAFGWIRSGQSSVDVISCASSPFADPWTSSSPSDEGLRARLFPGVLGATPDNKPGWFTQATPCEIPAPVWCAED